MTTTSLTPTEARARAAANPHALLADMQAGTVSLDRDALLAAMAVSRGASSPTTPTTTPTTQSDAGFWRRFRFESDSQYQARVSGMITRAASSERIARMSRSWEPPAGARAEWPVAALGGTGCPPVGIESVVAAMESPGYGIAPEPLLSRDADLSLDQLAEQVDQLMGGDGSRVVMPPQRPRAARPAPTPEQVAAVADEVERLLDAEPGR